MKLDATKVLPKKPSDGKTSPKGPYYAQIPIDLLSDDSISPRAKCQYAAYHSFSKQKNLSNSCQTFVSQSKLAKFLNISVRQAKRNQSELFNSGWIQVKKRGGTATNIITLISNKHVPSHDDNNQS